MAIRNWRRAARTVVTYLVIVVALGLMIALAWLTRNPEARVLARATEWPLVGGWARGFREAYLPPEPPVEIDEAPEIVYLDGRGSAVDEVIPSGVDPDRVLGARPSVWVSEGTPLFAEPESGAPEIDRTTAIANLRVAEQRGDWYRVRYGGELRWIHLEGYLESAEPPLGSDPLPPSPLPARPPDPERFALARELLGEGGAGARIGAYEVLSGAVDPELLAFLDRLVRPLERLYGERYGVVPVGEPDGAIVLFGRHADFAAYQEREVDLHGVRVSGVAAGGIVAIDMEGGLPEEIAATVIHELTHLLNRRALGPALPAWLEEGLAGDLAQSKVGADGTLHVDRLGGVTLERTDGREWRGGKASAIALGRALEEGRLQPLTDLLALDWQEFVAANADQLNYAQASFWVRYLLSDPALARGFRGFLAGVAAGGPVEPEELRRRLGEEWETLEEGFARWIRIQLHEPL